MKTETISILGLTRTGAAIGMAIKQSSLKVTIIGHDAASYRMREAKEDLKAIDKTEWNMVTAAAAGDIVIMALPARQQLQALQAIGAELKPHALLLDVGPLKGPAQQLAATAVTSGHYVGVAPILAADALADGREAPLSARGDIFDESVWALMPAVNADPQAVETAVKFGKLLGASPFFIDADEYDRLTQGVDTLPGLLAAATFNAVTGSPGWRDLVRLAGNQFALATVPLREGGELATQVAHNREASLRWLDAIIKELSVVRRWVQEGETDVLAARLEQLQEEQARWMSERVRNNWVEIEATDYDGTSIGEQLLGRWGRRGDKDE